MVCYSKTVMKFRAILPKLGVLNSTKMLSIDIDRSSRFGYIFLSVDEPGNRLRLLSKVY